MAAMTTPSQNRGQRSLPPEDSQIFDYLTGVTAEQSVGSGIKAADWIMTHPLSDIKNTVSVFAALVTGNGTALHNAINRYMGWVQDNPIASLKTWVQRQLAGLQTQILRLGIYLTGQIQLTAALLQRRFDTAIKAEQRARVRGDRRDRTFTRRQVRALNAAINHEAASSYRAGFNERLHGITAIIGYLAAHNDISGRVIGDAVNGVLDLASVDDPLARLALGFIMRHIVDKLGVDKLAGDAVQELLGPLLGAPRPTGLASVITDISDRLGALEGTWGQFWANGGSDIEQAGREWSALTAPLTDVALIAWLGQAVVDPTAWAREITDVTAPVLTAAKDAFTTILRDA